MSQVVHVPVQPWKGNGNKIFNAGGMGGGEIRQNFFCISKKGAILFFKQFVVIVRISIYLQPKWRCGDLAELTTASWEIIAPNNMFII